MNQKKWHPYHLLDKLLQTTVILLVLLFILYPFIMVFKEAMTDAGNRFDLSEFVLYFSSNISLLKNSLLVASVTMLLTTLFSVIVAVYHFISGPLMKKIITATLALTMISPPFVTSLAYINLFGKRGFISHDLLQLTYNPYGAHGIILMQTIGFVSLNALLLVGVMKKIDVSVIESAQSLGAKTNAVIKDMLIPLMKQGILVVALLSFIRSLADFTTPSIIGGSFRVLATEGYLSIIAQGNIKQAAMINIIIFLPSIAAFMVYIRNHKIFTSRTQGMSFSQLQLKRQGWLYKVCRLLTFFILGCLFLQYGSIFLTAVTTKYRGNLSFSLQNILDSRPYISSTFTRSIIYALIAGVLGSMLSFIILYYSQVKNLKWMKWIDFIATMPYILPGTFFGLGYIFAFSNEPLKLTGTSMIVILNVLFRQLSFSTKTASAALSQINPEIFDSVQDLGGSRIHELKDVVFPLSKEGLYVSFVNGFTSTMTTIGSIIFLVYPSQKVITLVLFDVVQSGKYRIASAIACYIILICLAVNGLGYLMINKKRGRERDVSDSRAA
ncbi:ABC transporter permease [Vagococcus elongatus]|uniref:ABC transporter permease n=1 Tax=Vagococcus elongatus TaxID=180344 RepID=A0A430B261_9ENTE|nr:iron ABC transporter permease [Vagococcus elongatus]RSU14312.1 ABC transporter permease [Vagococcus elongatus]